MTTKRPFSRPANKTNKEIDTFIFCLISVIFPVCRRCFILPIIQQCIERFVHGYIQVPVPIPVPIPVPGPVPVCVRVPVPVHLYM